MIPALDIPSVRIFAGDCREVMRQLPESSVRCCVTSPPYWSLRDYGCEGQLGLEETPDEFVSVMVDVFREVRRVLADDGTLWLNLGDTYAGSWGAQGRQGSSGQMATRSVVQARSIAAHPQRKSLTGSMKRYPDLKPKDLIGIPWRVAFALQADGWWLRQEIIWHKPNPMPESVTDRCTKAHEHVFLLAKSGRYFFDAAAISEASVSTAPSGNGFSGRQGGSAHHVRGGGCGTAEPWRPNQTRNARSVWTIATHPFPEAHFATFPEALAQRCIRAGSASGDTVLDPFSGAGTVALVAREEGRKFVGAELNRDYIAIAARRLAQGVLPLEVTA